MSSQAERIPLPETRRAILMSDGTHRPTVHVHVETRPCVVKNALGVSFPAYEHVFMCTRTNARRRWGVEPRASKPGDVEETLS